MEEKTLKARFIQKYDTTEGWSNKADFIPKKGELIIYTDVANGGAIKIGDGENPVGALPFVAGSMRQGKDGICSIVLNDRGTDNNLEDPINSIEAYGNYSLATGFGTSAMGAQSVALGYYTEANGKSSLAGGEIKYPYQLNTPDNPAHGHIQANGEGSMAFGYVPYNFEACGLEAGGNGAVATGYAHGIVLVDETGTQSLQGGIQATGDGAHAEGYVGNGFTSDEDLQVEVRTMGTKARGKGAHAEGIATWATGHGAHAEGLLTKASGDYTHTEGLFAEAAGDVSHAGGILNKSISRVTFAHGHGNVAGGKGFRITGQGIGEIEGTGYYDLNTIEGIEIGQNYIVRMKEGVSETLEGKITNIEGTRVYVDCYNIDLTLDDLNDGYNMEELQDFSKSNSDCNYLCIIGHPELGDVSIGFNAITTGENNIASERSTAAFGRDNKALGQYSFATGRGNTVNFGSFASGLLNIVSGVTSHAEGNHNIASGNSTHAEGFYTEASAPYAHAEGEGSADKPLKAGGRGSHAEGYKTTTSNLYAHAEGRESTASGDSSHSEGLGSVASNTAAHAEGVGTNASGYGAHAEGEKTRATNYYAHVEGRGDTNTGATGDSSHAEGQYTLASAPGAHSEGIRTQATNSGAHAEGKNTIAAGLYSHAEGDVDNWTIIQINGNDIKADAHGHYSHREGRNTTAYNNGAHAEGEGSIAYGFQSHAEGKNTQAIGGQSHAEGNTTIAQANYSHAGGLGTKATTAAQTAIGKYNTDDSNALFIVGAGSSDSARANCFSTGNDGTQDYIKVGDSKFTETQLGYLQGSTSNIQTQLNTLTSTKAKRVDLYSPSHHQNAHTTSVIALCYAPTDENCGGATRSYSAGQLTFYRSNGIYAPVVAAVSMSPSYGEADKIRTKIFRSADFLIFEPCTFEYNKVRYGGIKFKVSEAISQYITFVGETTFDIFSLDVYKTSETGEITQILNQEVYDSFKYNVVHDDSGWVDTKNNLFLTSGKTVGLSQGGTGATTVEGVKENFGFLSVKMQQLSPKALVKELDISNHPTGKLVNNIFAIALNLKYDSRTISMTGLQAIRTDAGGWIYVNGQDIQKNIVYSGAVQIKSNNIIMLANFRAFDLETSTETSILDDNSGTIINDVIIYYM